MRQIVEFALAAEERVESLWQIGLFEVGCFDPREAAAGEGVGQDLAQALGAFEPFERIFAEIDRLGAGWLSVDFLPGRTADQDLPTMRGSADELKSHLWSQERAT